VKFTKSCLPGAFLIDLDRREDDRGYFARTMCLKELSDNGIDVSFVQQNMSRSETKGTLRGFHYQRQPAAETKLIRCTAGAIFDVIVDLRPGSPTYLKHEGFELTAENERQVLVPEGCAHAFLTLVDATSVSYLVSSFYVPGAEDGLRYDDPRLGVPWPIPVTGVSPKDLSWPLLEARADLAQED
jgi:dTDP-4-dehydrorhamnose 3,5-epimerase